MYEFNLGKKSNIFLFGSLMLFACGGNEAVRVNNYSCENDSENVSSVDLNLSEMNLGERPKGEYFPGLDKEKRDSIIEIIGTWKGDWYRGERLEIVKKSDGNFYRINFYQDSTFHEHELKVLDTNGVLSYINMDEESLEYYRIEENGDLGMYSSYRRFRVIDKR